MLLAAPGLTSTATASTPPSSALVADEAPTILVKSLLSQRLKQRVNCRPVRLICPLRAYMLLRTPVVAPEWRLVVLLI